MISLPQSVEEARLQANGSSEFRAGGTDLQERLELNLVRNHIVDLRDVKHLDQINLKQRKLGSKFTIQSLAESPEINRDYPALAKSAAALATPQIRATATLGGNLLQRSRCWYFRHPFLRCFKSGADTCPAREGDHHYGVCFDVGPCVAPHPSTLGLALLTYEARLEIQGDRDWTLEELYGDGTDSTKDHLLPDDKLLLAVKMPAPLKNERGGYFRAISRARAEWPLVEMAARVVIKRNRIHFVRLAMGGVANIPIRLRAVEEFLTKKPLNTEVFREAGKLAATGANPLPMTRYKLSIIPGCLIETLTQTTRFSE